MSAEDNREFIASLEQATLETILEVKKNMERAVNLVEREAKINCPVDSGILRASISSDITFNEKEIVGTVGSNQDIAPYVHEGTGIYAKDGNGRKTPWVYHAKAGKYKGFHTTEGQRAQPFLEDAKMSNIAKIEKILGGK